MATFWYQGIEGHAETVGIEWNEEKWRTQTLEGQWRSEDIQNLARNKKGVDVQERLAALGNQWNISKISPTIAGEYPNYFWKTSLKRIEYACDIRSSFRQIQPSEILTSPREEKLGSHHGDESNVVRV